MLLFDGQHMSCMHVKLLRVVEILIFIQTRWLNLASSNMSGPPNYGRFSGATFKSSLLTA